MNTKRKKPRDIGGLTDDWDTFVAEIFPPEYANDSDHLSSVPASEPAVSEPSSRPSSRASGLMELDGTSEQDDQEGEDSHAVRFGGFEPQEPIVKLAVHLFLLCFLLYEDLLIKSLGCERSGHTNINSLYSFSVCGPSAALLTSFFFRLMHSRRSRITHLHSCFRIRNLPVRPRRRKLTS